MARSLALLALASVVVAQTTTVSIFLPTFDKQELVASVVAADSSKTTYFINCPKGTESDECGIASGGQTVVYGPKTFALSYTFDSDEYGSYKEDIGCSLDPTRDYASCSLSVSQDYDGISTVTSTAEASTGYLKYLAPVTVTAGANKLKGDSDSSEDTATTLSTVASPASATGSADATATESGSSESESTSAAESGSSAASAEAASTPTATDNAAGPMVTQNAVLVGAAALVGAMLL